MAAYERYVLAGLKFEPNSDALNHERQLAIEMLTPKTVHHYHLKCLDILKAKKTLQTLTDDELALFDAFSEDYGQTPQFYEVEMELIALQNLDQIGGSKETHLADLFTKFENVLNYLHRRFVS